MEPFTTDLLGLLAKTPLWMKLALGLTAFGVYWKKSNWPNKFLPVLNLFLPAIIYPILSETIGLGEVQPDQAYWKPYATSVFIGFLIGIFCEFFHEGLVAKLKIFFPALKFPDETATSPKEPIPPKPNG